MILRRQRQKYKNNEIRRKVAICSLFFALLSTFSIFSQSRLPIKRGEPQRYVNGEPNDSLSSQIFLLDDNDSSFIFENDSLIIDSSSSIIKVYPDSVIEEWEQREIAFNPNPTKAVWLSALFPGLGQVYNRRYWKLPIIVGGFMGLGYATS